MLPHHPALLFWDFENVMNARGVSTSVGVPSDPALISGFVSQTGGGPAEVFGDGVGTVFLTRHLGTHEVFLWFAVTRAVFLDGLTFRHWHNHNPGYPTHPKYSVQLQLDSGDGYESVGAPLELSNATYGGTDTITVARALEPGGYKLRWHPKGLKNKAPDTSSEFFAFKHLALNGCPLDQRHDVPTACSVPSVEPAQCAVPAPPPAPDAPVEPAKMTVEKVAPGYVTVRIAGVTVAGLKVMRSKFPGACVGSGRAFDTGALIGFRHRDALTDEQKAAIFGPKPPAHLAVLLDELPNS